HVRFLQAVQIHHVAVHTGQFGQTHFRSAHGFARGEAELRQTTLQRHLTTLETGLDGAARTGSLAFMTMTAGLAEAAADTTAEALGGRTGTLCGAQFVQTHRHSPSTRTMYETLLIMPRTEGVSSTSTVWPIRRRPRPRTQALCFSSRPLVLFTCVTLILSAIVTFRLSALSSGSLRPFYRAWRQRIPRRPSLSNPRTWREPQ